MTCFLDLARIGLGIACVPDYMLKENDQLTPLMLKEPLPGRQLILPSMTVLLSLRLLNALLKCLLP